MTLPRSSLLARPWQLVRSPMLARALTLGASLVLTVVAARLLGPAAAGSFFVAIALLQAAATAGRFGTDNLALKHAAGNPGRAAANWPAFVRICGIASVPPMLILAAALLWSPWAEPGLIGPLPVLLFAVATPAAALSVLAGSTLRGLGHLVPGIIAETGAVPGLATLVLLVGSVLGVGPDGDTGSGLGSGSGLSSGVGAIAPHGGRLTLALVGYAVSQLLTAALAMVVCRRRLARHAPEVTTASPSAGGLFREHRSALSAMMVTSLVFFLLTWSPVIVLGLAGNPVEAAYYNVAARITAFITVVPALQVSLLTPAFAADHQHGRIEALNRLARSATRTALAVALPLALVCLIAPAIVLRLFGAGYEPAAAALMVMAAGSALVVACGPVNAVLLTCGYEIWASRVNVALLILSTVAMLLVSGPAGAAGVAAVLLSATLIYSLAAGWLLNDRESIRPGYLPLPRLAAGRAS